MFQYKNIIETLDRDEHIIRIIRQHFIKFFFPLIIILLCISLLFFLMPWFFNFHTRGLYVFLLILLIMILYIIKKIFLWYRNCWIITNKRIIDIDQKRILQKTISHIPYRKIKDITFHTRGLFQTLFRLGNIEIATIDINYNIVLPHVSRPQKVLQLIYQLTEKQQMNNNKNITITPTQ